MVRRLAKMHSRLGLSAIIGYVLLITLVVTLATFVTVWYKGTSERQIGQTLEHFENTAECSDVKYEVVFLYGDCELEIYNLGKFKMDKVKLDYYLANGEVESETLELNIMPRYGVETEEMPRDSEILKVKVTPIIVTDSKEISCTSERTHVPKEILCHEGA